MRAPRVVLAAGALQTPLILWRSGLGLSEIGRNLFLHPVSAAVGSYRNKIEAWSGPAQTVMCDHYAHLQGPYGFRLETVPAHPGLSALALPWQGGQAHRDLMRGAGRMASIIVLTRDRQAGHVEASRDGHLAVHYRVSAEVQSFLRQGVVAALRVHAAAGAEEILTLHSREHHLRHITPDSLETFCREVARSAMARNWSVLFSAHQMGTCRMGSSRRTAVCDPTGQVYGVKGLYIGDASALPGSTGVNPMIAIMALAHHTAQHVASS